MTKLIEVEYSYLREWNYNHKFVFIAFLGNSEVISLCSMFLIYGCIVYDFGCSIINSRRQPLKRLLFRRSPFLWQFKEFKFFWGAVFF